MMAATLTGVAIGALGGCASETSRGPAPKATVVLRGDHYAPARTTIEAGQRVTFVNGSGRINTAETDGVGFFDLDRVEHDRRERFDTHLMRPGEAHTFEFDEPGRYEYHSSLHGDMTGLIVVRP